MYKLIQWVLSYLFLVSGGLWLGYTIGRLIKEG